MEYKYIATLMQRRNLKENMHGFVCKYVVFGDYDETNKIFTDIYGNEYYYMMSSGAINYDVDMSVFNVIKLDELKKLEEYKDKDLEYISCDYLDRAEEKAYIIGFTKTFNPFLSVINLDEVQNEADRTEEGKQQKKIGTPNVEKLEQIILDVADGKYTIPQMEKMKDTLECVKDVVENTIGTIETKIGAINENKSLQDYINEQLEKDIIKPKIPEVNKTLDARSIAIKVAQEKKKEKEIQEKPEVVQPIKKEEKVSIEETLNEIKKTIIAQDEPVKRLITEMAMMELDPLKKKYAILIVGGTGTGKTKSIEKLAQILNKKIYIVDTLQLSKAGYTGKDIEQVLYDLYKDCGSDIKTAENSIMYFDEIDKKGSSKKDDVSGQAVLNILLKLIEGSTYDATRDTKTSSEVVKIDTSNIIVVCGGAFSDVLENLKTNKMGFNRENTNINEAVELDTEAFVKHGMMPREFMGRMKIIKYNDLTQEDIERVLLESDESALRVQQRVFDKIGVKLKFTDGYTSKVAEKAYKMKTGARGLEGIIDTTTWKAFAEVSDHEGEYSSVTLTEETVEDNNKYKLVKRRQKK